MRDRERGHRPLGQAGGRQRDPRAGWVDRERAMGDVVDEQQVVALGQRGQGRELVAREDGAVGVGGVDQADRARARGDRGGHGVDVDAEATVAAGGHEHGLAAGGDDRRGEVEVARVAEDDLVAGVDRGQQRERDAGLGALGADHLEGVVAGAAEHARGLVAQRLDEVGRVLAQRLGADRLAHRLDGAGRRAGEAHEPAQVGPVGGQAGGAVGVERVGVEAHDADGVAVGHVVPHRAVAGAQGAQAVRRDAVGGGRAAPGQHAAHARRSRRTTR